MPEQHEVKPYSMPPLDPSHLIPCEAHPFNDEVFPLIEVADNLEDYRIAMQRDMVSDYNVALIGILRELSFREAGLPRGDEASQAELLRAAADITATLGLDRYVTVHEYWQETPEEISERVRTTRKELGLNQTEFAERLGDSSRFVVNRIEHGKVDFNSKRRAEIYKALGIDPRTELGPQ